MHRATLKTNKYSLQSSDYRLIITERQYSESIVKEKLSFGHRSSFYFYNLN